MQQLLLNSDGTCVSRGYGGGYIPVLEGAGQAGARACCTVHTGDR